MGAIDGCEARILDGSCRGEVPTAVMSVLRQEWLAGNEWWRAGSRLWNKLHHEHIRNAEPASDSGRIMHISWSSCRTHRAPMVRLVFNSTDGANPAQDEHVHPHDTGHDPA